MILLVFLFLIIYGLRLPIIYNSVALVFGILSVGLLFYRKKRIWIQILIKDKISILVLFIIISLLSWSFIHPTFSQTYDYTLVRPFIGVLICFLTSFLWMAYYYEKNKDINRFLRDFVIVNVIQCLIMAFAFFSDDIRTFVQLFQDPAVIAIGGYYGGIRGLALTPNAYFGLAYILAVAMLINNYLYVYDPTQRRSYIIFFVILFIGSMSAGRTAIVGGVLSVLLLVFLSWLERRIDLLFKYILGMLLIAILVIISAICFVSNEYIDLIFERLLPFAFEFFYQYINTGELETESTGQLRNMYYAIDWGTFFIGDGMWTTTSGSYYGGTDAGYMRNILFMGISGMIILFSYVAVMINSILKYNNLVSGRIDILIIFCTIWALVAHGKGEIIGYPNMTNVHFYLLFSFFTLHRAFGNCKK